MPQDGDTTVAVLVSGGLDSAILYARMKTEHSRAIPIYIKGGLRWEPAELATLESFLDKVAGTEREELVVLEEPIADVYGDHWSTTGQDVPGAETRDDSVYLPGRNILLMVKAAVWCRLRNIGTLALGSLGSNPFPDATPEFFMNLEALLNQALEGELKIIRPFATLHKTDVLALGRDLPLHLTFSCINPMGGQHCGVCNKCAERRQGFAEARISDGTVYHSVGVIVTAAQEFVSGPDDRAG